MITSLEGCLADLGELRNTAKCSTAKGSIGLHASREPKRRFLRVFIAEACSV
jgi:hypothetical protein